ncbi:MAG: 50S ribosomal protein L4 [Patescibacteria group bacterium]
MQAKTLNKKETKTSNGMSASVYNTQGKEVRTIDLPENIFDVPMNNDLIHQVVTSMQSNARAGGPLAHTKDRSEVRGGGKKPWRQKGTGRARHGSSRSPIWIGGGITHGPRNDKDYSRRIPKKMRMKALTTTLSQKFRAGHVLFVDSISFAAPKTKDAKVVLAALAGISGFEKITTKKNNAVVLALAKNDANTKKSFANFGNVSVEEIRNLNPIDVMSATYLIIENPDEAIAFLSTKSN